jgi:hypothetical protein
MSEITRPPQYSWAVTGAKTAPDAGLIDNGWVPGQIPLPDNQNWLQDNAAAWTRYLTTVFPNQPISADGITAPIPTDGPALRLGFNQGPVLYCAEYSVANSRVQISLVDFLNSIPVTLNTGSLAALDTVFAAQSLHAGDNGEVRIGDEASSINGEYAGQFIVSPYVAKGVQLVAGMRHVVTGVNPRQRFIESGSFRPLSTEAQAGAALDKDQFLNKGNLLKGKASVRVTRASAGTMTIVGSVLGYNVASVTVIGPSILEVTFQDSSEINFITVNPVARGAMGDPPFTPGCFHTYAAGVATITLTMHVGAAFVEFGDAGGSYTMIVDVEAY